MRAILLLSMSLFFAACDSSSSHESRSCTLNGTPVDCKTFDALSKPVSKKALKVQVSVAANVTENQIEILENANDVASNSALECSVEFFAGQIMTYTKTQNTLKLTHNNESIILTHLTANKYRSEIITEDDVKLVTILTLDQDRFSVTTTCSLVNN